MLAALALFLVTPTIAWRADLDDALREAAASERPVAAVFVETGQERTQAMLQMTFTHANVAHLLAQSIPVRIEAREEGELLAEAYQVKAFPTTVILSSKDEVVARIEGTAGPRQFGFEMQRALEAFQLMTSGGGSPAKLAMCCALRGELGQAKEHLDEAEKSAAKDLWQAYAAIGDWHQGQREFRDAIPYFEKAASLAKTPLERSYAHVSIVACCREIQDYDKARESTRILLEDPNTPEPDREYAERSHRYLRLIRSNRLTPQ